MASFTTVPATIIKNSVDVQSPWDPDLPNSASKPSMVGVSEEDSADSATTGTVRVQDTSGELEWKATAGWKRIGDKATYFPFSGGTITGDITLADGKNIILNTTTGTKIGTATTQKIGFYNATPIVQPSAYTQTYATASKTLPAATAADLVTTATTQTTPYGFATQAQGDAIATQFNALRVDLDNTKKVLNQLIDDLQALGVVG